MFIETLFTQPIYFFRIIIIVIFSITLHELAHGWAAMSQGDNTPQKTGHLTLNPVVHMGKESIIFLCLMGIAWGQMPINPSKFRSRKLGNILVSAAGPLSNLTLGIIFILVMKLLANLNFSALFSIEFLYLAARINLMLFLFNLLPIPPLDGFHVFSEIFPKLKPLENSYFGLFAMMLLFIIPEFGIGLSDIANLVIQSMLGESISF
ncbi:MAG: site-2 protease family protein [Nostoc sp. ZfuVER08]|jgi:Zn-dependent protease|uniref:Site-2 protease family protein n=1 Tax=Nostoc punctiforme FACHB-252 TaxID=1357509 RepID=A0ABR8H6I9_NOSPU|nr:site-2 protease family protein [Nostoc punctiforme]MBD2610780.1 site-2 protease family protein [Nostoc punctiforme FACHB-252]MDZ8010490.1 site-2 protease family protein [Nostoc sp. ZfuVER08]